MKRKRSGKRELRITYLATIRFPSERAHGLAIAKMCEALAKQGIDVELVVPRRIESIKLPTSNWRKLYGIKHGYKLTRLWAPDWLWFNWYTPKCFHPIAFLLESFSFAIAALFYLRKDKSSLVYTREFFLVPWLLLLRKKVFVEVHHWPENEMILWIYKLLFSRIQGFICISPSLQEKVQKLGVDRKKISLAPSGVDKSFFKKKEKAMARQETGLPIEKKIVMYVGSPTKEKGINTVYRAACLLKSQKHWLFVIVGKSFLPGETLEFKTKFPNIFFTGLQSPTKIPTFLAAADVLVLPNSLKWGEKVYGEYTSPLKLYEYLASGKPIVASRVPAIETVVENRKQVLFFRPDDFRDLAKKIAILLGNHYLSKNLTRQAKKLAQGHTWETRAKKALSFIKNQ